MAQHQPPDVVEAARKLLAAPTPRTWAMMSDDPVKTAGYLIDQAGGVKAARACITAAARLRKRPQGRPVAQTVRELLALAQIIQFNEHCTPAQSYRILARQLGCDDVDRLVRKLRDAAT
jgi:hypothetical protein